MSSDQAVFDRQQMIDIKAAVDATLDIFKDILGRKSKHTNGSYSLQDLDQRLVLVNEEKWKSIRTRLDGVRGQMSESGEKEGPCKLLCDIIVKIDEGTQEVTNTVQTQLSDVSALEAKIFQHEETLRQCRDELVVHKTKALKQMADMAGLEGKLRYLQELVDEKNSKLIVLQKSDNVQLWEAEKKRVLKEANEEIEKLKAEIEEIKQSRERYQQKMSQIEASFRKLQLKMKSGGNKSEPTIPEEGETADVLSRKNFMQDKDILFLERELYNLQASTVGVIGGIRTDFQKLGHNFVKNGHVDNTYQTLCNRMEQVYDAVAEGDMQKAKDNLPAHYTFHENDSKQIKRIRRISAPMVLPTPKVMKSIVGERIKKENLEMPKNTANPVIMVPETRKLHSVNPLRYFPHMSQTFILDQYEKFEEFDRNGDGELDLPEVVKLVTNLGFDFNAHQLQDASPTCIISMTERNKLKKRRTKKKRRLHDAMLEVDMDNNYMLDFYEFLLVVDKIYSKTGKCDVFTNGLSQLRKNKMSKSCTVQ